MVDRSTQLELRLLGEASAQVGGETLPGGLGQGPQRLLAQLAVARGRSVARSTLAFTLWPDSDEAQARTNLRKGLHQLRRCLPNVATWVEIDQQQLRLRIDGPAVVDLEVFESALERGDDLAAIVAYGGDLLPECYDDWVLAERDRLRQCAGRALGRLAAGAAERGDDRAVLDHASAHVAIDPLAEEAYRAMMSAHARMGNRAEALRTYHRCTQILSQELGVEPGPHTQRTYENLRTPAGAAAYAARPRSDAALVGRDDELALLRHCWARAVGGEAHLVVVTGEPGVGKSRLTNEFVRDIGDQATVAQARSYEVARRIPWGPIVDWLRAPRLARRLATVAPAWRSELSVLLPELADEDDSVKGPAATLDPGRRKQLFDAVGTAFLAEPGPLVLVIDDLQWCDTDTIELIGFLVASHATSPLLIVGTARDTEVEPGHPLDATINGLRRVGMVTEVALGCLDRDATAELARRLTDSSLSVDQLDRIWRDTNGNPLFVVETARAGLDGSRAGTLPVTVRATISARLGGLSPAARSIVERAAVIGRQFSVDVLVESADESEDVVVESLDELWRHQIIREQGDSYDFHHDKIREVAGDSLSPVRRRRLNEAVADALLAVNGTEPGPHSAQVAAHLEQAGRVVPAAVAFAGAARHALGVHALDEAEAACRRGLALLEPIPAGPLRDEHELTLRLLLAPTLIALGGYASSAGMEAFERCISLCGRLGRSPNPPTLRGLGLAAVVSCRFDRAAAQGEALVATGDDPVAVTEGHYLLGVTAFWRGDPAGSRRNLQAAVDSYVPERGVEHRTYYSQDPYGVCQARLGLTLGWSGETEAGWRRLDEAHVFASSIGHPTTLAYVLLYHAFAGAEFGDMARLRSAVEEGAQLWIGQQMATFDLLSRCFRPWLEFLEGDHRAIDALRVAVSGLDHQTERLHFSYGLSTVARACLVVGDLDEGLDTARRAIDWGVDRDQRYLEPLLRQVEGQLLAAGGDVAGAEEAVAAAVSLARSQGAALLERKAQGVLDGLRARP